MKDHTRNLHPNTVSFIRMTPEVATLLGEIIHALFSALKWGQSCKAFLAEILMRLAERESFECSHDAFSEDLFPAMAEGVRRNKVSRWGKKLKDHQLRSNYQAVWIVPRNPKPLASGEYIGMPTEYRRGDFWNLFKCVQFDAEKCDLMDLPLKNRRQRIRAVVVDYLKAVGAVPIERVAKEEKEKKEKDASPPCKCTCGCAPCAKCLAKPATDGEAAGASEPVLSVQIENEKKRLLEIERDFISIGTAMLNRGTKISIVDNKLDAVSKSARTQLKTAVARKAGRGSDYAPDTEARAHGRAAMMVAIDALKDAQAQAEIIGKGKHGAKFEELWKALEQWRVFENRAEISFEGGQPK